MGLSNTTGGITYLNLKEGKFARKNANGDIELYDAVEGLITSIEFQDDEYNGTKFRKLKLVLEDEGQKYLARAGKKTSNKKEDLQKALVYLQRRIDKL